MRETVPVTASVASSPGMSPFDQQHQQEQHCGLRAEHQQQSGQQQREGIERERGGGRRNSGWRQGGTAIGGSEG